MSRIAKKPIKFPAGVEVKINDSFIGIKGPKGTLEKNIYRNIELNLESDSLTLKPRNSDKHTKAMWGTEFAHIKNMLKGVTDGFEKVLELEGIGYKVILKGQDLELSIGFNKPVTVKCPEGIAF